MIMFFSWVYDDICYRYWMKYGKTLTESQDEYLLRSQAFFYSLGENLLIIYYFLSIKISYQKILDSFRITNRCHHNYKQHK
jgi:hypothetical protein